MSKFGDAAFQWMRKHEHVSITSEELWLGLCRAEPALTQKTPTRKTPRGTCMRDLRKDSRFKVGNRMVSLAVES
jgi:hypothetical protein